ncbi:MAG: AAA family ATPase [Balneolaceae bacterium]
MERLKKLSDTKSKEVDDTFRRFLYDRIEWEQRLILILGHRGAGKTTLLLQRMKEHGPGAIYLTLDDIYFEANRLIHLIDTLYEEGYRRFFLDEVHRYVHWSKDLKNAFDNYSDIQITATGSSILEVSKGQADLSRRAAIYQLPGLSFREFLRLDVQVAFDIVPLDTILQSHHELAAGYYERADILTSFRKYLRTGYYPFFKESEKSYPQKLLETTWLVLDIDIAPYEELHHSSIRNMKKLLYVIGQSVPFKPNISKLAEKLGVSRNSVLKMLDALDRARVLSLLKSDTRGISYLQKPEKIYLGNPNLAYLLSSGKPETGTLRETFFLNHLQVNHNVTSSRWADFMIDDTWTFEVGGPGKTDEQIRGVPNAYIAADRIKGGSGNRIPLWLFGFLY